MEDNNLSKYRKGIYIFLFLIIVILFVILLVLTYSGTIHLINEDTIVFSILGFIIFLSILMVIDAFYKK